MIEAPDAGGGFWGINQAVDQLVAAANIGFTVSDAAGADLIAAINKLLSKVEGHEMKMDRLSRQLPLGSSPAATTFKPFLATIASDPEQGIAVALKRLRQNLIDARGAIQKSMASYQKTEQENAASMRSQGEWT